MEECLPYNSDDQIKEVETGGQMARMGYKEII
jgi:hypothetical protein